MVPRLFIALVLLCLTSESLSAQAGRTVRVRIASNARIDTAEFESIGPDSLTIKEDGQIIAVLAPYEPVVVEVWEGILRVRWSRGSVPLTQSELGGAEIIRVTAGGRRDRLYRGVFETRLDESAGGGLEVVNVVGIEDYVASVLPAEYPFTEIEGVKAQAIVIRTYAITAATRNGSGYNLRDDTGSQVYRGVQDETELSVEVARMTAGSTLVYRGETIEAVYSSHCGGYSANNEDIWGTDPVPYLRGRKDPYGKDAPVAKWSTSADVGEVHDKLSERLGKRVKGFKVSDRGAGKHVREVKLKFKDAPDETMRGERFRSILNDALGSPLLQSSVFEIEKRSGRYRFKGKGSGHGVGFCQWGARAQAQEGRSYEDILKFYYKGVDITDAVPEAVAFHAARDTNVKPEEKPGSTSGSTSSSESGKKPRQRRVGW